ncbi:MAG: hypothetical protein PHI18_06645, partial [bacterium]|nr:hypothetical protein [bacterium]
MRRTFFEATNIHFGQITYLFDQIWPLAVGMWNLRWQVAGYASVRSDPTVDELRERFVTGSGINGANIKRACLEMTWQQQQDHLARVVLTNIIAIHESWISQVLTDLGLKSNTRVKMLQFPTDRATNTGIWSCVDDITQTESPMLKE